MKIATLHHRLAPAYEPNLPEIGLNIKFAALENCERLKPIYAMCEYGLARSALPSSPLVSLSSSNGFPDWSDDFIPSTLPDN